MSRESSNPPPLPEPADLLAELETLRTQLAPLVHNAPCNRENRQGEVLFRLLPCLTPEARADLETRLEQTPWMTLPLREKLAPALGSIQAKLDKLTHAAGHDDLTGLARRTVFEQALLTEMERTRRTGLSLSLAVLDIDDFKRINDICGHVHGDHVLRVVSNVLRQNTRRADLAARLGGEEFALLMSATTQTSALFLLERIMNAVRDLRFDCPQPDSKPQVTLSVGLACYKGFRDMQPLELIELADQALYSAKQSGKDRIVKARFKDISPDLSSRTLVDTAEKHFLFHDLSS